MVVFAGDCTCRFFYRHILAFGMSAELFGEETYLYLCKAVFSSQHSAWFINWFACVLRANRIVTGKESILSSGYKLDKSSIDTFKRFLCKRLFPEDGSSFIREIKHIFYRLPLLQPREHILPTTFTMGRFWEYYRQVLFSKDAEEAFSCGVGTEVGSI